MTAYTHDPQRLRAFLIEHGLTSSTAGALVGVSGRTVRRWCSPLDRGGKRMPWAAHELLRRLVDESKPPGA